MGFEDEGGSRLTWFLIGIGIGAVVALLYAPYKGKDARRILSKRAEDARDFLSEHGNDIYERGREIVDEAADLVERGRKLARG